MKVIVETEFLRAEITELPKVKESDDSEFCRLFELYRLAALAVGFSPETIKESMPET